MSMCCKLTFVCFRGAQNSGSQSFSTHLSRQLQLLRLLESLGVTEPEGGARSLLDLYEHCNVLNTPQEIMAGIVEAIGHLAILGSDLEVLKELFIKLYTPRFATHFSDAALCQVAEQIQVGNEALQDINLCIQANLPADLPKKCSDEATA